MSKPFPSRITLADFVDRWPKDVSGMRARSLIVDFLGTMLIDAALSKDGTAEEARGAHRAIAKILESVRGVTADKAAPKTITASKPLNRFAGDKPEQPKPNDKS